MVRYMKQQREIVARVSGDHARWVKFIAEAASIMRAPPPAYRVPDGRKAHQYAVFFDQYQRYLRSLKPPDYCVPLHGATTAWLESLAGLSMQVSVAIQKNDAVELDRVVRAASEPQRRLGSAQRMRAKTLEGVRKMFEARPKPVPKPIKIPWLTGKRR